MSLEWRILTCSCCSRRMPIIALCNDCRSHAAAQTAPLETMPPKGPSTHILQGKTVPQKQSIPCSKCGKSMMMTCFCDQCSNEVNLFIK